MPSGRISTRPKPRSAPPLASAFTGIGAPFAVFDVDSEPPRAVYGFDYLLVRHDLHVVWRGNRLPDDAEALARRVTGH